MLVPYNASCSVVLQGSDTRQPTIWKRDFIIKLRLRWNVASDMFISWSAVKEMNRVPDHISASAVLHADRKPDHIRPAGVVLHANRDMTTLLV